MTTSETKKTILYDRHLALGAKMAPFGGYEMPIQYSGIFDEHFATRKNATIFDTCHMGEFTIKGKNAVKDLDKVLSCPVAEMKPGQCRYGFICNQNGGVIDDQIIYRLDENDFFMVVNASTQDADIKWITSCVSSGTSIKNISEETGKIDLQGPLSAKIMQRLFEKPIHDLKYYHWMFNWYKNNKIIISRTGYTGEIGFEIYLDATRTKSFWDDCLSLGTKPAGLGARDTLRLEMGYPLYGHELNAGRNAAESGLTRAIAPNKEFIGSETVQNVSKSSFMLCGINLDGRRTARNNDAIYNSAGATIGTVTSGSFAPSLGHAIALGYVEIKYSAAGTRVSIAAGKTELSGTIVEMPFYKNSTARKKLSDFL
jgi:aminomethyltransferase